MSKFCTLNTKPNRNGSGYIFSSCLGQAGKEQVIWAVFISTGLRRNPIRQEFPSVKFFRLCQKHSPLNFDLARYIRLNRGSISQINFNPISRMIAYLTRPPLHRNPQSQRCFLWQVVNSILSIGLTTYAHASLSSNHWMGCQDREGI
jgi:hypothetical protein